jgi:hypothetical protein
MLLLSNNEVAYQVVEKVLPISAWRRRQEFQEWESGRPGKRVDKRIWVKKQRAINHLLERQGLLIFFQAHPSCK